MTQKESNKQDKEVTSSKKAIKDDEEIIKQKQLAYLKDHEQEIIDFVKAQSPKVESVQIDWEETIWGVSGFINSSKDITIKGYINNNQNSGWVISMDINSDGTVNLKKMFLVHKIDIGDTANNE